MAKFETVVAIVQETFPYVKSGRWHNGDTWVWEFWLDHYEAIIEPISVKKWAKQPERPEDEMFLHTPIPRLHITSDAVYRIIPIVDVERLSSVTIASEIVSQLRQTMKTKRAE